MKLFKFILLFVALSFSVALPGQITLDPLVVCPAEQSEYVVHFEAGQVLNPIFNIVAPGVSGSWSQPNPPMVGAGCTDSFGAAVSNGDFTDIGGNLRATFTNGTNPRISISSAGGAALSAGAYRLSVRLGLSGSSGSGNLVRNFRFIVRQPIDIVFALDRSGSMECDTDEDSAADWPGCSTSNTAGAPDDRRWNVLASAVDHFVDKLDDLHTLASDRLSVVYFDGNTSTTGGLTNDLTPFRDVAAFRGAGATTIFKTELDNMNAGGNDLGRNGTSIGAGLVKAVNGRYGGSEDANRREVVLLFSDGEQNGGNWLRTSGTSGIGRVIEQSRSNNTPVLDLNAAAVDDIEVLSVSMVSTGTGPALLQAVAKDPSNYFNVMPGQEDRFGSDIAGHAFNEIFNQYSPRFIGAKRMSLAGKPQAKFTVNRNVNRLIFEAFYSGSIGQRSVAAKIFRNGVDVTSRGQRRVTANGLRFIFPLYDLADIPSEGTWRVELSPAPGSRLPSGLDVSIFGTADDHAIRFDAGTVEDKLTVGNNFRPELSLFEEDQPVTNATVTATISKPGDDLGDLLARTEVSQLPSSHTESASCADLKYGALRQSQPKALANLFRTKSNTVALKPTGNGRYAGVYNDADVTGVYKIRFNITYTSPRLGEVVRMEEQTRYVNFPSPKLNRTVQEVKGEEMQGGYTITTVEPSFTVNGKKRLVGPGFGAAFGVSNPAVRLAARDNCNGNYQLNVSGPPQEKFTLHLLDNEVFTGTVKEFNASGQSRQKGYLSFSGGRTLPQGDFDLRFDEGIYGQIGLGRRFGSLLGAELVGGYYAFEPDFHILGGTAYLNVYLGGSGSSSVMVGAGPGYYFPEGGDARLGGSVRAALERQFGRLTLGVEGGYFRLTDPEIDFATIGLRATIGL